jgi:hypothetical protein
LIVVDESVDPKLRVNDVWEAERLKSSTFTDTAVEEESAPEVPVIVRVALPDATPVTARVAEAVPPEVRIRSVGLMLPLTHVTQPLICDMPRCTLPEKPPLLVKVRVDVPEDLTLTAKDPGFAEREKAARTVTRTTTDRVTVPLLPLTVTS